jgi:hypothetical protein
MGEGSDMELEHNKQRPPLLQLRLVGTVFRRGRVIGWTGRGKTVCAYRQVLLLDSGSCNLLELHIAITRDPCDAHNVLSGR